LFAAAPPTSTAASWTVGDGRARHRPTGRCARDRLLAAVVILYSPWVLVVSLAFHLAQIDNHSGPIVSTYGVAPSC
jgi:hypothetical protein